MTVLTMNAAIFHEPGAITFESIEVPDLGPRDVLVRVTACGICGSDLHTFRKGMYVEPGQVIGHEFVGTVERTGPDVADIAEGLRVAGFTIGNCGTCFWCERGEYGLCPEIFSRSIGYGRAGAFAEFVVIERAQLGLNVFEVPDSIDDLSAATIEPVAVAAGAVKAAEIGPGDKVVVLGAGLIGNVCMQIAKARGAERVVVIDINPLRVQAALDHGADAAFDARSGDAIEWVKSELGVGRYAFNEGAMADVVIEVSGAPSAVTQSFEMVRSGGTIVFVGLPEVAAPVDTTKIVHKQPKIIGSLAGDFPGAIDLLDRKLVVTGDLVDRVRGLDEIQDAFDQATTERDIMKTVILMDAR
jgi:threonine dehydrogenase-like Zn-dependent dehydrogenase